MTERHVHYAKKVVESFKELLPDAALKEITNGEFEELELMIQEALSDELHTATDQMDGLIRRLRSEIDRPELGM